MPTVLMDTSILIYTFDPRDVERQEKAISLLLKLEENGTGCLSVQCLSEFVNVSTAVLHLPIDQVMTQVEKWAASFPVFNLTPQVILEATRGVRDHGLAYYDAQVWAVARLNQIPLIVAEEFMDGQTLEGVRFADPFTGKYDIQTWL
jgi:predicted nucleic acid-binding protein